MSVRVRRTYGIDHLPSRRLAGGSNNEHWRVGDDLVLRRYSPLRSEPQVTYEHAVLAELAAHGWPVAAPLPGPDGRTFVVDGGRHHALFPRLRGRSRPMPPGPLGELLGRLHDTMSCVTIPSPVGVFPRVLDIVHDPLWRQLDAVRDRTLRGLVRRELDELGRALVDADRDAAPTGVVHGDWSSAQILQRGGGVSGILDFDFAHPDLLVVDLAPMTSVLPPDESLAFVRGYETERHLTDAEVTLLGLVQRGRQLQHVWPAVHGMLLADGEDGRWERHISVQLDQLEQLKGRWRSLEPALRRSAA